MKKGFTLIELITAIAIMAALTAITIPSYLKIMSDKQDKLYDATVSEIIEATKDYMTTNPTSFSGITTNGYVDIDIEDLCDYNYLDCPLNDPRDNSSILGSVRVAKTNNTYSYTLNRSTN